MSLSITTPQPTRRPLTSSIKVLLNHDQIQNVPLTKATENCFHPLTQVESESVEENLRVAVKKKLSISTTVNISHPILIACNNQQHAKQTSNNLQVKSI